MSERFAMLPFKALSRMYELKGNEALLFNWLCLHRGDDGQCNPSDDLLMDETQLTRSPLFAARKGLIDSGWIECDFETRNYKLAFHPGKQDEPPKPGETRPGKQDEKAKVIPESRMVHPGKQDGSSRKAGQIIPVSRMAYKEEQTMNKPRTNQGTKRAKTAPPSRPGPGFVSQPEEITNEHPAIVTLRSVTQRYPNKALWPKIARTLGEEFDSVRLMDCYATWVERGANPMNFTWLFDWYVNGIPQTQNRQRAGPGKTVAEINAANAAIALQRTLERMGDE